MPRLMDTVRVAQPEQWQINKPRRRAQTGGLKRASGKESTLALFEIILINRKKILRGALLGAVAGAILALSLHDRFESTARLMPLGSQINFTNASGEDLTRSGPLLIRLMESRTVRDRMVERFDLTRVYRVALKGAARTALARYTVFHEDPRSGITSITVTDNDAQRAQAMSAAYTEELNRVIADLSMSEGRDQSIFLEERLRIAKLDLDSTAKQLSDFSSKAALIDVEEQGAVLTGAVISLHAHLIKASSELEGLRQIYTNSNPQVRMVLGQVAAFKGELIRTNRAPLEGFEVPVRRAFSPFPTIRELPLLVVTYSELADRLAIQKSAYEVMSQMLEDVRIQEIRDIPVAEILDAASVPSEKSFPPRLEIILLGAIVAVVSKIIWLLGGEYWRATFPRAAMETNQGSEDVFTRVAVRASILGSTMREIS